MVIAKVLFLMCQRTDTLRRIEIEIVGVKPIL